VPDFRDGEISVRFEGISGRIDQGAGILFNLKPNGDYLTIRANPLENNWCCGSSRRASARRSLGSATRRPRRASGTTSRCGSQGPRSPARYLRGMALATLIGAGCIALSPRCMRTRTPTLPRYPSTIRKKPTVAKLRSWRFSILRHRAEYLGTVQAPDERTAEAAAVAAFDLDEHQRRRLAVRED
jgi:hypothetical protein